MCVGISAQLNGGCVMTLLRCFRMASLLVFCSIPCSVQASLPDTVSAKQEHWVSDRELLRRRCFGMSLESVFGPMKNRTIGDMLLCTVSISLRVGRAKGCSDLRGCGRSRTNVARAPVADGHRLGQHQGRGTGGRNALSTAENPGTCVYVYRTPADSMDLKTWPELRHAAWSRVP